MFISWLGFLIDPSSTPARVTLGVVTVLVVLQNWMALSASLPRDVSNTWLGRFTLGSFLFNVFAMAELVLVNFGLQAHKWLEAQRAFVASVQRWDLALWKYRSALVDLFHEWDTDGDGQITRKEFYRGVTKLIPAAPMNEARDARQRLGIIAPWMHNKAPCTMICARASLRCAPTTHASTLARVALRALTQHLDPLLARSPSPRTRTRAPAAQVYRLFDMYDKDSDDAIDYSELTQLLEDEKPSRLQSNGRRQPSAAIAPCWLPGFPEGPSRACPSRSVWERSGTDAY